MSIPTEEEAEQLEEETIPVVVEYTVQEVIGESICSGKTLRAVLSVLEIIKQTGEVLIYGGHYESEANINYQLFDLTGTELLDGRFHHYESTGYYLDTFGWFQLSLANYELCNEDQLRFL